MTQSHTSPVLHAEAEPEQKEAITQADEKLENEPEDGGGDGNMVEVNGETLDTSTVTWTTKEHRRLVWKLDVVIVTITMLIYVSSYIDRGNLGNARLMGIEKDVLDNNDTKFSIALICFYITYLTFAIPGTLAAKYLLPSWSLAIGAAIWSLGATCMSAVQNPAGVYTCRLVIGIGEAMFGQAVPLYFSYWYTKREIAKRLALYISAGALAGAFGGMIAYGVARIPHTVIDRWRCLFLIEGLPGFLLAVIIFTCLPDYPNRSKYLTARQREIATTRMARQSNNEGHDGIDKHALKVAFCNWKTYLMALMYLCLNVNLSSIGGFLPTIVRGLGYTDADAQLFTVPPYAVALVMTVLISTISDRLQSRGIAVACAYSIGVAGWGILLGLDAASTEKRILSIRYFGCCLVVVPAYAGIPIQLSWVSANNPVQTQRAVALAMLQALGQGGSFIGSFAFPSKDRPQYVRGVSINIVFQVLGAALAVGMTLWCRWENRRRDRVEGGRPTSTEGLDVKNLFDKAPGFRYMV